VKLDKLFQSLLLTGGVVLFLTAPASSEEIRKKVQGDSSKKTLRQTTSNATGAVTDKGFVTTQSPIFAPRPRKQRVDLSQILSSAISARKAEPTTKIPHLSEIEQISKSADVLVQSPTPSPAPAPSIVQITGVKANPTDKGVEIILQTTQGNQLQVTNRSAGNNFIADISGAQLRLPSGDGFTFRSEKPLAGITEITVTNLDGNTVRVTVKGEAGLPQAELFDDNEGLVFGFAPAATATSPPQQPETPQAEEKPEAETPQEKPSAQQDEPIELVVTGEQDGYSVPNATAGTRTDTPLRDIPQSIQVIPQQVLRDQQANRLEEALRNAPGITQGFSVPGAVSTFTIRGFTINSTSGNNFLRDGLPDPTVGGVIELPSIEQVEVLKGPASVLFGFGNPGGTINLVTKKPLRDPFYEIEATVGSYDFYRGALDLSGPLNDSKTVLYRLNTSYRNSGSFIDFFDSEYLGVSPVVNFKIGDRTNLILDGEYIKVNTANYSGVPRSGTLLSNPNGEIPRNRNYAEPSDESNQTIGGIGYRLEHKFSDNWTLRNAFRASFRSYDDTFTNPTGGPIVNNRLLNRFKRDFEENQDIYALITDVVGKFSTGSIQHQLIVGVDLNRFTQRRVTSDTATQIDLFNPVYNQPLGPLELFLDDDIRRDSLGIYIQDQVTLAQNLKLLLGVRFDTFEQKTLNLFANTEINQSDDAFSPRVGIVYQPIPPISVYAGYSRSFTPPPVGIALNRTPFLPERGTQYEVGVKADLSNRLSATLAFYDLTRTNVETTDLADTRFSIQTGEQRSRGIELSIGGEILPGWNIIAGYAYTDAEVTEDNTPGRVGNQLNNTPKNAFNLWTTYEIQKGNLQGLGFGLGLFFVGDRPVDLANTFEIPSYLRTDASIFYKRDRFRAALNFKNLFDVDYFAFALNQNRLYYGDPFTVQGTISWQF
jgi:iron complex outermembrane receptor protein